MPNEKSTPSASDDLETAEEKSRTIDERVPQRQDPDLVPEVVMPGAVGAYVPHAGVGIEGPLGDAMPGPGEKVLEQEGKAQRMPPTRG